MQGGQEAQVTRGLQGVFSMLAPAPGLTRGHRCPPCAQLVHLSEGALPSGKEPAGDPDKAGGTPVRREKQTPTPSNSWLGAAPEGASLVFLV